MTMGRSSREGEREGEITAKRHMLVLHEGISGTSWKKYWQHRARTTSEANQDPRTTEG